MYFVFEIHLLEKKYFVFCIFRPTSKVFDKSISNTFFSKVFCILYLNRAKKYLLQHCIIYV